MVNRQKSEISKYKTWRLGQIKIAKGGRSLPVEDISKALNLMTVQPEADPID
jgi:hypothetical protein